MANPDILFRGIPRSKTRGYTAEVLSKLDPSRVVIPCCGSFSLAATSIGAGVKPDKIFCGDVSLYSQALGMAIMGNGDWKLQLIDDNFSYLAPMIESGDPIEKAVAVLFAIRVLQYTVRNKAAHWKIRERELVENREVYQAQLRDQISELAERLHGVEFRSQDMWETMNEYMHDQDAVLLVNPPRYTGGYDKMFEGIDSVFAWDVPEFRMFTEDEYQPLMEMLGLEPSLTLMYYATPDKDPSYLWGDPWRAVFADRPGSKRGVSINWIIANRDPVGLKVSRVIPQAKGARYRLYDDSFEITEKVSLRAKKIDKITGDYYRDLFIHRLEGGQAEVYMALFLDGHLFGIAGINAYGVLEFKTKESEEQNTGLLTFCFTVESERYKRLQKLALMSVCSSWFWQAAYGNSCSGAKRQTRRINSS